MPKKSILFIADKPDWAYHFIVKTWVEELSKKYDCYIAFEKDYQIRVKDFGLLDILKSQLLNLSQPNRPIKYKIHPSRKYAYPIYKNPPVYKVETEEKTEKTEFDFIIEMAYYLQYTAEFPFKSKKKLVGLYTDCFPHEGPSYDGKTRTDLKTLDRETFFNRYLRSYDGIIAGNENLYQDYSPFTHKLVIANGIYRQDEFLSNPNVGKSKGLTIGWTGTPNRPMKGFREVIEPAIAEVQKTGRDITLKTRFSGDYSGLLSFYQDVDLVIIASSADTGPSLFSEASLCNVPSISTRIGFPKMIIQHNQNGIFVNRNIHEMKNAIIDLYDNRDKLVTFAQRIKKDYLNRMDNQKSINHIIQYLDQL